MTTTTDTYADILRQDALEAVDYVLEYIHTRGGSIDEIGLHYVAEGAIWIRQQVLRVAEEVCELAEADGAGRKVLSDAEQALSDARDLVLDEVDSIVADVVSRRSS